MEDGGSRLLNSQFSILNSVVIIGSDSPDLPPSYVQEAFARLDGGADVVLGPAEDGGYYLIGLRAPQPRLLREVPMSTPTVLADTLALARELGLRAELLPLWYDVDTSAELRRLAEGLLDAPPEVAPCTRAFLASFERGEFEGVAPQESLFATELRLTKGEFEEVAPQESPFFQGS
jgi:hypothetical protein